MNPVPTTTEPFQRLIVWQKAHELTISIYTLTKAFPREELYALTSQIRRAVISIEANIAEGSKRRTKKDRHHFYVMADGSLEEVKCFLLLAQDLGYCSAEDSGRLLAQAREVGRLLSGLMRSLDQIVGL